MVAKSRRLGLSSGVPRAVSTALVLALLGACGVQHEPDVGQRRADPDPPPPAVALDVSAARRSADVVASGGSAAPYNYGPTVLFEDGRYRAWWCSQVPNTGPPGDDILHASAPALDEEFRSERGAPAVPVFNGRPGGFDGMHTCDPSVVKVGGRYFLYYTGASGDHAHGNAIGVASSPDGTRWRREAAGEPIVTAANEKRRGNTYGAGQPSVLHLDGWFYLMFTDTTAAGTGANGAGQFVLRARDAEFSNRVEALTEAGFRPVDESSTRSWSVVDAFSADWMWVEALDVFAIAHQVDGGTAITFWDREFTRHPYERLLLSGRWREGPGLVRAPDGSARVSPENPCGDVPLDVIRATTANPSPTELRHVGVDVIGVRACEGLRDTRSLLEGFGVPSPRRTVDVVLGDARLRVERRSVAEGMASAVLAERVPALDELPIAGTISAAAPALRAPDGSVGLLDDRGRMWEVDPSAAEANDSVVTDVTEREWQAMLHDRDVG
ncbi:hypothetical protein [Parasphingorhabdus pacifica]